MLHLQMDFKTSPFYADGCSEPALASHPDTYEQPARRTEAPEHSHPEQGPRCALFPAA